jgi:phage FluMu protein Com
MRTFSEKDVWTEETGDCYIMRDFISCTRCQLLNQFQIKKDKMTGYLSWIGENRNVYRDLVGKAEVKRPMGRQI